MSANIDLLPGEQVVMSSDNDILTLTTKRVRYDSAVFGTSSFISITLDSVASCGLTMKPYPILLLLAVLALLGAFPEFLFRGGMPWLTLGAVAVFAVAYALTRQAVISIASNGGQTILVPAKGMSRSSIVEFLEAVEREKLQ